MSSEPYGKRLRDLRYLAGLTLEDVEKLTDVNKSTLSQTENGKRKVSIELMQKLAHLYGGWNAIILYVLLQSISTDVEISALLEKKLT